MTSLQNDSVVLQNTAHYSWVNTNPSTVPTKNSLKPTTFPAQDHQWDITVQTHHSHIFIALALRNTPSKHQFGR